MELARLSAVITADDRQFRSKMDAADKKGKDTARSISSSFSNLKLNLPSISGGLSRMAGEARGAFAGAFAGMGTELVSGALSAATAGFNATIKAGLDFNKMMEGASIVFENFAGSAEGAQKHLADLKTFAKSSPFDLPDLIQASARMQAFGVNIRDVVPQLQNLQNAAALAAGTSGNFTESLDGIVNALGQMRAKGSVSAEEMQQLAERGIPAWDLLAAKIGKTVEETRKLSEQGKLRGAPAADALLEAFGEGKFQGLGERLAKSTLGKESNLRDAMTQQAGAAAQDTVQAYNSALDEAIKRAQGPGVASLAKSANAPVAAGLQIASDLSSGQTTLKDIGRALPQTAVDTVTEIKDILSKGIAGAWGAVKEIGSGVAESAGVQMGDAAAAGTKKSLQIQSPSQVYIGFGEMAAAGFQIGFESGKGKLRVGLGDVKVDSEAMVNTLIDRSSEGMKKWGKAIEKAGGEEFLKAVEAMSQRLSIDPNKLLNVMAFESKLRPDIKNPNSSATGLIQFMDSTATALGTTTDKLKGMDAIGQLAYVEKYFAQFRNLADTQEALYTAVLAGRPVSDPDSVLFTSGGKKTGAAYKANAALDADKSGTITAAEATANVFKQGFLNATRPLSDAAVQAEPLFDRLISAAPKAKETLLRLGDLAAPVQSLAQRAGDGAAQRPFEPAMTIRAPFDPVRGADVSLAGQFAQKLDTSALDARIKTLGDSLKGLQPATDVAKSATRNWADEIIQSSEKVNGASDRLQNFKDRLGQGFEDLIGALVTGGDRWQDVARNIAVDFFNTLASEMMLSATGGKYGSLGGLLGGLVGGLFGGFGGFGGKKAGGGAVAGNKMYLVGEEGPELFVPGASGRIVPNGQTQQMMSGGQPQAGKVINVTINVPINAPAGTVSPQTRQQIATQTAQSLNAALQRNG
ncbi:MAG: tape measure protein [Acidobacteria bacterium]|nr:tape measure protein [Acidobacteriota bacterium]